jgi:hypothetical protein
MVLGLTKRFLQKTHKTNLASKQSERLPYVKNNKLLTAVQSMDFFKDAVQTHLSGGDNSEFVKKYLNKSLLTMQIALIDVLRQNDQFINILLEKPIYEAFAQKPQVRITIDGRPVEKEIIEAVSNDLFNQDINASTTPYKAFQDACVLTRAYGGGGVFINNPTNLAKEDLPFLDVKPFSIRNLKNYNKQNKHFNIQIFNTNYNKIPKENVVLMTNRPQRVNNLSVARPQVCGIPVLSEIDYFWTAYRDYVYYKNLRMESIDENKRTFLSIDIDALVKKGESKDMSDLFQELLDCLDIIAQGNAKTLTALPPYFKVDYKQVNLEFLAVGYDQVQEDIATMAEIPQRVLFQKSDTSGLTANNPDNDVFDASLLNFRNQFLSDLEKMIKMFIFPRHGLPTNAQLELVYSKSTKLNPEQEMQKKQNQFNTLQAMLQGGSISQDIFIDKINEIGLFDNPFEITATPNKVNEYEEAII